MVDPAAPTVAVPAREAHARIVLRGGARPGEAGPGGPSGIVARVGAGPHESAGRLASVALAVLLAARIRRG